MAAAHHAGLGLKPEHFEDALRSEDADLWFEVHAENYLLDGGPRLHWLQRIGERHPLSVHGVALSLGGDTLPDPLQLSRLRRLVQQLRPARVSEHLAWSALHGQALPDLLPLPRSTAVLQQVAHNIDCVQNALGCSIALENPAHYLNLEPLADWSEPDFLQALHRRTGCTLLLDVNNVWVSAHNLGFDAQAYLDAFPLDAVSQIHLAGHQTDASGLLIDSHDAPVAPAVWALYQRVLARCGARPTLIERDAHLPAWDVLLAERTLAQDLMQQLSKQASDAAALAADLAP